jgi:prephenate dehydrogenase
MRSALVVGTGLIGTSVALALRAKGLTVHLRDADPGVAQVAASLGAGVAEEPAGMVDLAIVAVPPAATGAVLAQVQAGNTARHYTDVASVKLIPQQDVVALVGDSPCYVGGHPMSGGERSGPRAARADLFEGCTWVLTPTSHTGLDTLNAGLELVTLCRAVPVVMDAGVHDRAIARISHAPHVLASVLAAHLQDVDERSVRLAGPGIKGLIRIAGADPRLWLDILSANSADVADVLELLVTDLDATVEGLRAMGAADEEKRRGGIQVVERLLLKGVSGYARVQQEAVPPRVTGTRPLSGSPQESPESS